jgi:3-methyladenine DNA glycosylase Tag
MTFLFYEIHHSVFTFEISQRLKKYPTRESIVFDNFLWSFVGNKPILNMSWNGDTKEVLSQTPESQAMSKGLKALGFRSVGPTTCYAMMQSVGMVVDHPKESKEWLKSRQDGYQQR